MELNTSIFLFLNNLTVGNTALESIVVFFADKFSLIFLFGLIYYLFIHTDKKKGIRDIVVILTAAFVAWTLTHIIKYVIASPRPYLVLSEAHQLMDYGGNDSFPSGHATFFSALATALYFYHRRLGLLYIFGALIIGLSRVIAGIHWPIDIIVGYILGGVIGATTYYVFQSYEKRSKKIKIKNG